MPSSTTKTVTLGAILFIMNALSAQAFHVEYGTVCQTVGAACSYVSNDSSAGGSASTTVSGFCAPDLHCASQGAKCDSDDSCFNYCGTDGTCGGTGAGCNTQDAFMPGQVGIACDDSGKFQCTTTGGTTGKCEAVASTSLSVSISASASASADASVSTEDAISPAASQANARRSKRRMDEAAYHEHQVRSSDLRRAFARHQSKKIQ